MTLEGTNLFLYFRLHAGLRRLLQNLIIFYVLPIAVTEYELLTVPDTAHNLSNSTVSYTHLDVYKRQPLYASGLY